MATYRLEIFEPGPREPGLWQTHRSPELADDPAAIKWAEGVYADLAKDVPLAGFVLYEGKRFVHELPRPKTRK
jgi:hypothetical protein